MYSFQWIQHRPYHLLRFEVRTSDNKARLLGGIEWLAPMGPWTDLDGFAAVANDGGWCTTWRLEGVGGLCHLQPCAAEFFGRGVDIEFVLDPVAGEHKWLSWSGWIVHGANSGSGDPHISLTLMETAPEMSAQTASSSSATGAGPPAGPSDSQKTVTYLD